jgi:hypothetical protein
MLRCSPGLVRASLEARTAAAHSVLLDRPSRLAPLAPQDDVVKCDSPAASGERWSKRLASAHLAAALGIVGTATPALAHGFGQRYDLPLPLPLFLFGAAAVVALSFAVFSLFGFARRAGSLAPRAELTLTPPRRLAAVIVLLLRLLGVGVFVLTVLAGLIGDPNPYRNIAPTMVWIVWWVGLIYVSAFIGDVWTLLNPWRTLFDAADRLYRYAFGRALSWRLQYPHWLGAWPACVLLLAFAWIELIDPNAAVPAHLARLAIAYSLITFAGMLVFGRDAWLAHGEVFSVVFSLFARFAPTEIRAEPCRLALRPFGAGILDAPAVAPSTMAFVLLLLSTVLFDGLGATAAWSELEGALRPRLGQASMLIKTAGLVALWLVFLAAYLAVCTAMSVLARRSAAEIAQSFVLTLIPIAIGYHVAHYLVFLLIQGQYIIPLASDPFGWGWNLFGTAAYRVDIAAVGARFAWYAALAAIVLGHVMAIYLAHRRAIETLEVHAAWSQVPLTALMVLYTFTGLSIIADPIVERAAPATPSVATEALAVPAEAVLPLAGDGRLQKVAPGTLATAKLTYRVLGSAFHDATKTTVADLVYAYVFAYRWGARGADDARYDPTVDAATAPLRRTLVGLQIGATDATSRTFRVGDVSFVRELLTVDVYTTVASEDSEQDAAVAPPWSTLPWHLIVLMEEAVARGWAAFSQSEAVRRGVPWLDLVRADDLKGKLAALVAAFARDGYRPEVLRDLVGADEARKRWAALAAFGKTHGHFLVTNGPYRLKQWSADGVTLEAFRDLSYPLGVGSYDAYASPRRGFVTGAQSSGGRLTITGDIEVVEKFQRSYRLVRTPMRALAPEVLRRAAPECRYQVIDERGRVVLAGTARLDAAPEFVLDFNRKLQNGKYTIYAFIALAGNAITPDI